MKKEVNLTIYKNLSKYVRILNFRGCFCFFNSLSLDKAYIPKIKIDNNKILKLFKKNNLLKDFDIRAEDFIKICRKNFKPKFRQLYLIISEVCNFNCKYCRQVTHGSRRTAIMSAEKAHEVIDNFFKFSKNDPRGIVFYGGEPLLNKEVLVDSVEYIRRKEKKLKLRKSMDLTIITNGTGIDLTTARILKDNNVYIIVSVDGRKKEHDKLRVYNDGRGTFNDVLKGYNIYKSTGCRVGISCTIGSHNYNNLESVFDFFSKELKPVNIGINLPHDDYKNPLNDGLDLETFCKKIIRIFEKSTRDDLYIEHIMRKLKLLFNQEVKINDCPACGGRLVAMPDGKMGICEGAIGLDNFFFKSMKDVSKMSVTWYLTSPLFDGRCRNCLALGVCGGGCPFDGYLQGESVGLRDKRRCFFVQKVVEWGLYNFYLSNRKKIDNNNVFIPKREEHGNFLRMLRATKKKLPLQSSADFNKIKI